jgi:CheY-like chemotaxis protein/HPt (histidine-containing phosphotransfer) domain-containing protein
MEAKDLGEAKENARDIVNASKTLLDIVNGILDISKIEAGKIEIVNSKYDAHETFEELAKLITPKMNEKGLDFTYNIAPDLPPVLYGDHANVKKVVTNLLSNACKYTEKGYVHYEVNCVNSKNVSKLIISVEDSGRGIKKNSVDKMFTKFQRLEEDRNTTIEGTGLGLAITKQLIELMGGRIIVHTVYGEGSKFTVVINQRIEAPDSLEKNTKKVSSTLDLKDLRIMLVDDTPLNLKVAAKLLERYNANHVISVSSGFECIERIQRGEKYDFILLDDMMPKMSGVETLKKLKQIEGFNIPTIALTANAISGMREKYLADGFDDYLAKPIEKEQLIQVVNQILGRSATEEINIPDYLKNPDINSPAIRDNIIAVGDNVSVIETPKMEIIPVEDNIEELLGNKLERNYKEPVLEVFKIHEAGKDTFDSSSYQRNKEELEVLDDSVKETSGEEIPHIDVVPLVGVDNNTLGDLGKCDRKYLENNGVDVEHGLELLGDMDMYNMTINDFMAEVEAKWARIVDYKEKNDMPNYAIEVHSLKSDCKYLGFMDLADIAYQHELKSKENDSKFVNNNFNELETKYKKVLDIARNYVKDNPVSE